MKTLLHKTICIVFLFASSAALADIPGDSNADFSGMNIEELLNVKISVASKHEDTARTAPGIVTVITSDDIKNSGARDLIDVLQMVPGFTFGTDTQGIVSLGVRGLWAHEGKTLLLFDGLEMNEILYGTIQLGNHYPVASIKKIEIIRGPGSPIYGGSAELAVINIISKGADDIKGVEAYGSYGVMQTTYGHRDAGITYANTHGDFKISIGAFLGQGNRSDRDYTDALGNGYNFKNNSNLNPNFYNIGLSYKDLELRFIADWYNYTERNAYGISLSHPVDTNFHSYYFGAKYNFKITSQLSLLPEITFKQQWPWLANSYVAQEISGVPYDRKVQRKEGKLGVSYQAIEGENYSLNLLAGIEGHEDEAWDNIPWMTFNNGAKQVHIGDSAVYGQVTANTPVANFTLGARRDTPSSYGSTFVPRFAAVKLLDPWHFKLLVSEAYRAPVIQNIDSNSNIQPERTLTSEVEVGYRFSSSLFATANIFDQKIAHPIVYTSINNQDAYYNFAKTGSRGFEVSLSQHDHWGYTNLSYSYSAAQSNAIDIYKVDNKPGQLLSFPHQKLNFAGSYNLPIEGLKINPTVTYYSATFGYDFDPNAMSDPVTGAQLTIKQYTPAWLANLYLLKSNLCVKHLDIGVGVFNLFNKDYRFIQPYTGGQPPVPSSSREYVMNLNYRVEM